MPSFATVALLFVLFALVALFAVAFILWRALSLISWRLSAPNVPSKTVRLFLQPKVTVASPILRASAGAARRACSPGCRRQPSGQAEQALPHVSMPDTPLLRRAHGERKLPLAFRGLE